MNHNGLSARPFSQYSIGGPCIKIQGESLLYRVFSVPLFSLFELHNNKKIEFWISPPFNFMCRYSVGKFVHINLRT